MLTNLLNFFGIKTQKQKEEEYKASVAKCPYMSAQSSEAPAVSPMPAPQPVPEPVAPTNVEMVTMATSTQKDTTVTTVEVKAEPAKIQDTFTVNLTSDTIKFSAPDTPPAPKKSRKSKNSTAGVKPAGGPAKITTAKNGRKKR